MQLADFSFGFNRNLEQKLVKLDSSVWENYIQELGCSDSDIASRYSGDHNVH